MEPTGPPLVEQPAWRLHPTSPPWYIVRFRAMQKVMAKPGTGSVQQFQRNIETDIGWETYYPLISELKPLPRKRLSYAQRISSVQIVRPVVRPFLPCLLFARPSRAACGSISDYPNVMGYVAFGESGPALISNELINNLRRREEAGSAGVIPGRTPAEFIFDVGEHVRVARGPFVAWNAVVTELPDVPIEQINPETRLKLTIDIFGRLTSCEMAVEDVEKL